MPPYRYICTIMQLIADSGSTKTQWMLLPPATAGTATKGQPLQTIATAGMNPVRDSVDTLRHVLAAELLPQLGAAARAVRRVHFYGAGCIEPYSTVMREALAAACPAAAICVESDMLGAARALCGDEPGIACILGTGSNSCLYDGRHIARSTPALGWILGDEGSGAVLGRRLVGDVLKGQLPQHLADAFMATTGLTQAAIIERTYRQPEANRFLASLTPFLSAHCHEPAIRTMLLGEFRSFMQRNITAYARPDLPVHFAGGVAHAFASILREAVAACGFIPGTICAAPISMLAAYHTSHTATP